MNGMNGNGMNPLFSMFGNQMMNNMPGPMGNIMNLVNQFQQFKSTYNGTPQQAQQQVQQMLNNGQINQEQFNQAANTARQIMNMMGRR